MGRDPCEGGGIEPALLVPEHPIWETVVVDGGIVEPLVLEGIGSELNSPNGAASKGELFVNSAELPEDGDEPVELFFAAIFSFTTASSSGDNALSIHSCEPTNTLALNSHIQLQYHILNALSPNLIISSSTWLQPIGSKSGQVWLVPFVIPA